MAKFDPNEAFQEFANQRVADALSGLFAQFPRSGHGEPRDRAWQARVMPQLLADFDAASDAMDELASEMTDAARKRRAAARKAADASRSDTLIPGVQVFKVGQHLDRLTALAKAQPRGFGAPDRDPVESVEKIDTPTTASGPDGEPLRKASAVEPDATSDDVRTAEADFRDAHQSHKVAKDAWMRAGAPSSGPLHDAVEKTRTDSNEALGKLNAANRGGHGLSDPTAIAKV